VGCGTPLRADAGRVSGRPANPADPNATREMPAATPRSSRDSGEFRIGREATKDIGQGRSPLATQIISRSAVDALAKATPGGDSVLTPAPHHRAIAMLCKECQQVTRKKSPYCEHCGRPLTNLEGSVLLSARWSAGRTSAGEQAIYAAVTVRPSIRFLSGTPPRNLGFLIDMSVIRADTRGESRLKMVRKFLEHVVDEMSPSDHLTVAFFGNRPYLLVAGERIEDKRSAKRLIQKKMEALDLGEGRFLHEGIEQVCREVRRNLSQEKINRVIVVTDGPIQDPEDCLRLCEYESEAGIGFSTLTLSDGDNQAMQDVARAGNGKCYPNVEFRHIPEILSQELMTVRATFTTQVDMFVHVDPGWSVSRVFKVSPVITDMTPKIDLGRTPFSIKLSDLQLYDDQTLLLEIVPVAADPQRDTIAVAELVCDFPHEDVTNMTFSLPIRIGKPADAWDTEEEDILKIVKAIAGVFK